MKRKITTMIFATLFLICTVVLLESCKKTCKHTYSDWNEIKAATCTENGEKTRICTKCENMETQTIDAFGHNCYEEWETDENRHWRICTNEGCSEKINEACHKDENTDHKCDTCEYAMSEHSYGETQYTWNVDYTECIAHRTCTYCIDETKGHKQTANATNITSDITQEKSCVNPEKTTYNATFEEIAWAKTQVKEVETATELGHDFSGSYYFGQNVHWCSCQRTNCNATSEELAHIDDNHDHKCDVCQYKYSSHSYETANYVYEYNDDYTECTLMRVCSYCIEGTDGHMQFVTTTNITSTIKQNASCEKPEITTYKANFDGLSDWADYHYSTIDVETYPKLEHDYRWDFNDNEHWQTCKRENCTSTTEKESHLDSTHNHKCDDCNIILSKCTDENNDHFCDLCEKRITYCKDEDADQFCDICGTACKDNDNDHFCDDCGNKLSECVDEDKNHVCDICNGNVGEHKQADGKHYCGYCYQTTSECADDDHDHKCDVCKRSMSEHTYGEIVYTWEGDYTDYTGCTACKTCTYCTKETVGHTIYGYSTDINKIKYDATCLTAGSIQYHVTFDVNWASKTERFVIPATGHKLYDKWSYDSGAHYHECQNGCGGIFDGGVHTYESGICTVCGCHDVYGTEGLVFNYYQGNYHVIGYTGTATEVKIPYYYNNGIDDYALVVSIVEAFSNNTSIKSVTIPDSVTTISDNAFYNCSNLISVEVGNNLTTIGGNAFYGCISLTTIDLGQNLISVGINAFSNCTALTKIDLGKKLTSIGTKAFCDCISLTEFTLPQTVTDFGGSILKGCKNITKVTYSANVGVIGYLFGESSSYEKNADNMPESLIEVVINGGVNLCYGAFYGCANIKTITISSSIENIGQYAFKGCNGLTKVELLHGITKIPSETFTGLPSLTTVILPTSLTYIGSTAFHNCSQLVTVEVFDNVTYIGEGAFYGCKALNKIVIPSGVTSILKDTFHGCTSLTSVEIKGDITTIGDSAFAECSSLSNITIPQTVTNIGSNVFYGTKITKIIIPDSVKAIGDKVFENCTSLKTVVIHPNVTSLGSTILKDCTAVTDLTFSLSYGGLSTLFGSTSYSKLSCICINGGESIPEKAFQNCISLTMLEITCPMTNIGEYAFSGCNKLTTITITGDITSIGNYAFQGCSSLTEAPLPSTLTSIGNYAFKDCSSLTKITLPAKLKSIGNSAFSNCSTLNSIVIPEGVTYIGSSAFEFCLALTIVTLPSTITTISNSTFYNCSKLENINMPNSVTDIGSSAFYKCLKLENISIPNTVSYIGINAFKECNALKYNEYDNAYYLGNDENLYVVLIKATNTSIQSCKIHEDARIIYYQAFKDCTLLTSIEIAKNVISIGVQAFYNCSSLESIKVSKDNQKYSGVGNAIVETATKTLIVGSENTVIPTDGSVTSIGDYAFYKNVKITSLVIPDSILSIGAQAFRGCTNLKSITFSKNLTSIGNWAFYECTSLENVIIPGSIESWGGGAFYECTSLTTVVIEEGLIKLGSSKGYGEFQECTSLVSVTLPSTLTYIGYQTFRDCSLLTNIVIPKNITEIDDSAFSSCYKLVEVYNLSGLTITIGSTENGLLGYYAKVVHKSQDVESVIKTVNDYNFATINNVNYLIGYTGTLTEITLPDNYNGESYVINDYVFYGSSTLQSVIIGKDVTSIGKNAFTSCTSLKSIVISDSIQSIGKYAFGGCSSLEKVYYTGTADGWKEISIPFGNTPLTSATLYYYSETKPTEDGNYWYYAENKTVAIW